MPASLAIGAVVVLSAAAGGMPIVGPQVRIDPGGGPGAANETTASASEILPARIVGGWNDYRLPGVIRSGFSLSIDGGATWDDFLLRPPGPFQASTEGDPMVAHDDRTGTLWAGAISFTSSGGIYVARLDPGETEFEPSVMAELGLVDKGWMAAGPRPGLPETTRLYCAYNLGVIWSDDMGDTWTDPVPLGTGIGFLPRVGPDGELYIAYWDYDTGVLLKRSLNGGASFTTHTIATRMDVWGIQESTRVPGSFRTPSLNALDVDPNDGTLYAAYFDTTDMQGLNFNLDLYFTKSQDQGTTWTTPTVINGDGEPPGDQFFPWVEVDQAGRVHIVFLDTRHNDLDDDDASGLIDGYYMFSDDGGANWTEFRLTPASWNSFGVGFIGDYTGMAVAQNLVYPAYIVMDNGDQNIYTNAIEFPVNDPDVDGDGTVGVQDLLLVLAAWGPCPPDPDPCPADLDGDGVVGVTDLLFVLGAWD